MQKDTTLYNCSHSDDLSSDIEEQLSFLRSILSDLYELQELQDDKDMKSVEVSELEFEKTKYEKELSLVEPLYLANRTKLNSKNLIRRFLNYMQNINENILKEQHDKVDYLNFQIGMLCHEIAYTQDCLINLLEDLLILKQSVIQKLSGKPTSDTIIYHIENNNWYAAISFTKKIIDMSIKQRNPNGDV